MENAFTKIDTSAWGWERQRDVGHRAQTSSQMNKLLGSNVQHSDYGQQ